MNHRHALSNCDTRYMSYSSSHFVLYWTRSRKVENLLKFNEYWEDWKGFGGAPHISLEKCGRISRAQLRDHLVMPVYIYYPTKRPHAPWPREMKWWQLQRPLDTYGRTSWAKNTDLQKTLCLPMWSEPRDGPWFCIWGHAGVLMCSAVWCSKLTWVTDCQWLGKNCIGPQYHRGAFHLLAFDPICHHSILNDTPLFLSTTFINRSLQTWKGGPE